MKPRLFIGSSVESITIGYAAQQNLQRSAEVTVWDQGVFKLSVTAVESLLAILETCDFAMFVFSPDDLVTIRGEQNAAVRDNVIFELGLFVGVLGRDRCFILVPDKIQDLRIPTDLIGMTPATFETGRSDGSMQAATAPACHTIKQTIDRLGMRAGRAAAPRLGASPDVSVEKETPETDSSAAAREREARETTSRIPSWLDALVKAQYAQAAELLQQSLSTAETEEEKADLDSWLGRAKYYLNPKDGAEHLEKAIARYPTSEHPYVHLAYAHLGRDLLVEALSVAERGLGAAGTVTSLVQMKVRCLSVMGKSAQVQETLRQAIKDSPGNSDLFLALADHYSDQNDLENARAVLEDAEQQLPNNTEILDRYARLLAKMTDKKLALIPYGQLIRLQPDNPNHLSMRANAFLELELHDLAMRDYKKASELAEDKQGWILANIGNLLKNRGFYREGIEYLKRAIELDPESQYAHERLALAIKLRDEEEEKLQELIKEAKRELVAAKLRRAGLASAKVGPEGAA